MASKWKIMKIRYGLHIRRFIRKFLDCFYIAASAKENERGGQSHTSASVHIASVCCEHTLFFFIIIILSLVLPAKDQALCLHQILCEAQ